MKDFLDGDLLAERAGGESGVDEVVEVGDARGLDDIERFV
jgi:hypothetical protein